MNKHYISGIYTDRIAAPPTGEESRRKAQDLYNTAVDADRNAMSSTGEESRRWHRKAQVYASLALVEAQEAANEQARIGNLIALGAFDTDDGAYNRAIIRQYPEIAKALGIEENE